MEAFADCFEGLEDPRTGNARLHDLLEILMIALCTVLRGGQTPVDIHIFGRAKEEFLRVSVVIRDRQLLKPSLRLRLIATAFAPLTSPLSQ